MKAAYGSAKRFIDKFGYFQVGVFSTAFRAMLVKSISEEEWFRSLVSNFGPLAKFGVRIVRVRFRVWVSVMVGCRI